MAAPKVMSGARAMVGILDPATNEVAFVGLFNNVSYGLTYDAQPAYILGRFGPAEIDYTAQEPVNITCSGWRVIDHGPHKDAKVPALRELLTHEYIQLAVVDRQPRADGSFTRIATFKQVRPTGYSTTISARNLEEVTVTFVGVRVDDESESNEEAASALNLP
jgi:hypothetical protein